MIRQLNDDDREAALGLAGREPEQNLFIIGDIENYGMAADFMKLWGEFDERGRLAAVLMFFQDSFTIYAPQGCDVAAFIEIMRSHHFNTVSGGEQSIEPFVRALAFPKVHRTILASLSEVSDADSNAESAPVHALTLSDLEKLQALYVQVVEFGPQSEGSIRRELEAGHSRGCWIEADGRMVSVARTAAENSKTAMIIGVATLNEFRGRGYASAALTQLCRNLLRDGIKPCLFYDNPIAGKIYRRLGFVEIAKYTMLEK